MTKHVDARQCARAARWLPRNLTKLYRNAGVTPYWLDDGRHCWYRRQTDRGHEFLVLDARTGERQRAFDHARMASALHAHDIAADAHDLPIDWLRLSEPGAPVTVACGKRRFSFEPRSGALTALDDPAWPPGTVPSPDRHWAVQRRGHDLWLLDLVNGGEWQLTDDGAPWHSYGSIAGSNLEYVTQARTGEEALAVVSWSPDSRYFATHRLDERGVREITLVESTPPDGGAIPHAHRFRCSAPGDEVLATASMIVFEAATRQRRNLEHRPLPVTRETPIERSQLWWCDGGEALLLDIHRADRAYEVLRIDAASGAVRHLWTERSDTYVEANVGWNRPIGAVVGGGAAFLLISERDGYAHLYLHDGHSGAPQAALTRGSWVVQDILRVDDEAGRVVFLGAGDDPQSDPYLSGVYRVALDGSDLTRISIPGLHHEVTQAPVPGFMTWNGRPDFDAPRPCGVSPDGRFVISAASRIDRAPETVLEHVADGARFTLEITDTSALEAVGWRWPIPLELDSADGKHKIYGALWLPPDHHPSRPCPIVDAIYPGPQTIRTPKGSLSPHPGGVVHLGAAAALAELGLAVIIVDGTGGPGRSKAFHDISYGRMERAGGLEDHMAAIRQVAERFGGIDLDRVGIYGYSGGGTATARALFEYPDFFKVGVAAAGSHDLCGYTAYWGEKYQGPFDPERYEAARNARLAGNLRGKLMLVAGEMDDNCHPAMTLQVADALMRENKDFELLMLTGHHHNSAGGSLFFQNQQTGFLVRHLLGLELPPNWRELSGQPASPRTAS